MNKQQLPLIIGLAIPVLLVVVLAAIIYVPRLYLKPQFDFVYAVGSYPWYVDTTTDSFVHVEYRVVNDHLTKKVEPVQTSIDADPDPRSYYEYRRENVAPDFYRYDVSEQKNIPLSEEEALGLIVDPAEHAPDGFQVGYGRDDENILESIFGGRDYSQRVLEKGSVSVPLNLVGEADRYNSDFDFIGWLVE